MTDPCGHSNSTHPSGCWYIAVVDAVAAERERIRSAVEGMPQHWISGPEWDCETAEYAAPCSLHRDTVADPFLDRSAVLAIVEDKP